MQQERRLWRFCNYDLRNHNEVIRDYQNGQPVFLTKNGRGKYVLINIEEYEKQLTIYNVKVLIHSYCIYIKAITKTK